MISKTLIILAYEKLLGCAALQELPKAHCAVFRQVSASNALAVLNEILDFKARAMGSRPQRLRSCSWAWGRAPSKSSGN
jgi:hypothetical protein